MSEAERPRNAGTVAVSCSGTAIRSARKKGMGSIIPVLLILGLFLSFSLYLLLRYLSPQLEIPHPTRF